MEPSTIFALYLIYSTIFVTLFKLMTEIVSTSEDIHFRMFLSITIATLLWPMMLITFLILVSIANPRIISKSK